MEESAPNAIKIARSMAFIFVGTAMIVLQVSRTADKDLATPN